MAGSFCRNIVAITALLAVVAAALPAAAQNMLVQATWQGQAMRLPFRAVTQGGDSLTITSIRFYVHGLQSGGRPLTSSEHLLIDLDDSGRHVLPLLHRPTGSLHFGLGTHSRLDSLGAQGGALDPSNGMYWTWQTGFIQAKIEGTSPACTTKKHQFIYHLAWPAKARQRLPDEKVSLTLPVGSNALITLNWAADGWFQAINLRQQPQIMEPNAAAVTLLKAWAQSFQLR